MLSRGFLAVTAEAYRPPRFEFPRARTGPCGSVGGRRDHRLHHPAVPVTDVGGGQGGRFTRLTPIANVGVNARVILFKSLVVGGALLCEPVSPSPFQSVRAVFPHTAFR